MRHMLIVTHSGSATRVGMRLSGLRCYPGRIAETLAAIRHCAKTPVQAGMGAVIGAWVALSSFSSGAALAQVLPEEGCPKAHCDQGNVDLAHLDPPGATADVVWQFANLVGEQTGSDVGLGCSSNGAVAVCTYNGNANTTPGPNDEHDNVVAYDYSEQVQWTSGSSINLSAYTSAPLILEEGLQSDVVAVDNMRAIRFNDSNGQEVWNTQHGGGTPVSPVITDSGVILLANIGGPVTAIDSVTGDPLGTDLFQLPGDGNDDYFETHKTVAVSGNRTYIVMQHIIDGEIDENHIARLLALDVDADAQNEEGVLTEAWHFDDFTTGEEGSKSSPSIRVVGNQDCVFFDGWREVEGMEEPHIFAVCDTGTAGVELWAKQLPTPTFASFAEMPGGGSFWFIRSNSLRIWRVATSTGNYLDEIDLDALIGDSQVLHRPSSAMTITGTAVDPVMIVSVMNAVSPGSDPYVIAVDLDDESLLWAVAMPNGIVPAGQFPIVRNGSDTRVVFSAHGPGVWAIGIPD